MKRPNRTPRADSDRDYPAKGIDTAEILDSINDLVQSVAPDGSFLYTNRAWRDALGYDEPEVERLNLFDIIHPDCRAHCREMFRRVLSGENSGNIETDFIAKNGERISVDGSSSCSFKNGEPDATRSIFRNVTERKQAERALLDSEERFQAFMTNSPAAAFIKDENGRYVFANNTMQDLFSVAGYESKTITARDIAPEAAAKADKASQQVLETGAVHRTIEKATTADGISRDWMVIRFPFTQSNGRKLVGGLALDITERVAIEDALRKSEGEIKTLVEHSSEIIARFDRDLRFVFVNPATERVTGIAGDALIGRTMAEAGIPEETYRFLERSFQPVLESGEEMLFEYQTPPRFASIYVQIRATPELADDGETVESLLIVARDITERREMEEKLRASEQHYRALVEGSQGLICTHDLNGKLLSVNLAAQTSLGYEAQEVIGKNLREFITPETRRKFDDYLKYIRENATASGLMFVAAKDGGERVWKFHNVKLTESVREPVVLGHAQDVTEMRELQKQFENQSLTDDLTELYNRRGFLMFAERQLRIARAAHKETSVFVIFADMDGLKQINDVHGHEAGSAAIVKIAELLSGSFRGSDVIARLGGDEFVVLVVDERNKTQEIVVNRVQKKIADYNRQRNHPFDLSLSVGITPVDMRQPVSIEELLREADRAMYEQKRMRRNREKNA